MVLFARNRRYYLIPVEHKKENYGEIFDKRKNLIGRIRMRGKDIIVTEANGVVCLRLRKLGSSVKYRIEDHFGNYLGRVGVFKSHKEEIEVEDRYNKRVLFTKGFVEWTFTIQDKRKKKIAIGGTTNIMFSKDRFGIRHVRPSFLLSVKPHHPDSRFLLAVFIILLKKMSRTDISKYYLHMGPALPI